MEATRRQPGLISRAFEPLPLGSIVPTGWLLDQLRIQAAGLSGHLDEFWPDVAESAWIGGQAEGWERGPYWLDGVVPLAYLLDDTHLKSKVQRWVDHILDHQQEDGWLGPVRDLSRGDYYQPYDPWPVFVVLKALTQYQEASDDERVIPAMTRFLRKLDLLLAEKPLFEWGKSRCADLVLSIQWLHDRTGEAWLLDLASRAQAQGYDWSAHFAHFRYPHRVRRDETSQTTHVVNNAMAIKQPAVWFRQSGDEEDRQAIWQIIRTLDTYHGQATGLFAGDEHYAGKNPSQGTELCAVVEYMFSLETAVGILGHATLADCLERIAFNALPATFKPDMWAHQYDQQVNQAVCCIAEDPIYTTNGPASNIFGLEPTYGCCTANMHQGWPKFTSHLWMATPGGGLAAVAYAPCRVSAVNNNTAIQVQVNTAYPFEDTVRLLVQVDRPSRFPLDLRIPGWAAGATIEIAGEQCAADPGAFWHIERDWTAATEVILHLPMQVKVQRRYHRSVSIERGPLVYALRIGEDWKLVGGEPPHGDWEVYPTTPWNYALQIDPNRPELSLTFESRPLAGCSFSPEGTPVVARVRGRRIPDWALERNAAGPLPISPVSSTEPLEALELVPYGCTNLRIAEFPLLDQMATKEHDKDQ